MGALKAGALSAAIGRTPSGHQDWPARPARGFPGLRLLRSIPRGVGSASVLALLAIAGLTGMIFGGHLDRIRSQNGSLLDFAARTAGFAIQAVQISGNKELSQDEIIAISGISSRDSALLLDAAAVRARLLAQPLIAEASVKKLLPGRVVIALTEREPFALWQMDGAVKIVSVDGTVIDDMRDDRFLRLPHVVGQGANKRAKEYAALLEAVPELRPDVRAGILVSERRWTLKMTNGVEVKLPEVGAVDVLKSLVALNKSDRVLAKDIISVDLRVPGRVGFRLTEEAAATRAEILDKKLPKVKGRA